MVQIVTVPILGSSETVRLQQLGQPTRENCWNLYCSKPNHLHNSFAKCYSIVVVQTRPNNSSLGFLLGAQRYKNCSLATSAAPQEHKCLLDMLHRCRTLGTVRALTVLVDDCNPGKKCWKEYHIWVELILGCFHLELHPKPEMVNHQLMGVHPRGMCNSGIPLLSKFVRYTSTPWPITTWILCTTWTLL